MPVSKAKRLETIADEIRSLTNSPLYEFRQNNDYQVVPGEGDPDAEIVFIGEAPGEQEAKSGRPFVGAAGRVLSDLLASINLDREDVFITNVVKDRPPNNRDPKRDEIDLYTPFLIRQLEVIQPSVIATLGRFAMEFILDLFEMPEAGQKIGELHGQLLHAEAPFGPVTVLPLYHPAAAFYNRDQRATMEEDMQQLARFVPQEKRAAGKGREAQAGNDADEGDMDKQAIAGLLLEIADLLEAQDGNTFRVRAYRQGASTVRQTDEPVVDLARRDDREALEALPNIGEGLANVIIEYVQTGRSSQLDELRGEVTPVGLFAEVPGIGRELAQRVVDQLSINTLEELEQAAHDGRLESVDGFGPKRVESVKLSLAGKLSRSAQRHRQQVAGTAAAPEEPPVELLLEIDREYRRQAEVDKLPTIAPRRFNPENEAWLPLFKTERDGWKFTALFSNTKQAHELGKTDDWVVIYYRQNGHEEQNTVVTETQGPLEGRRVVRGREAETRRYYEKEQS